MSHLHSFKTSMWVDIDEKVSIMKIANVLGEFARFTLITKEEAGHTISKEMYAYARKEKSNHGGIGETLFAQTRECS